MTRRARQSDSRRDQHSVRYYWSHLPADERAPLDARQDYSRSTYGYMLIEDVRNTIMPFGIGSRGRAVSARVEPPSDPVEQLLESALRPDYARDLADAVFDFVRDSAVELLTHGEAYYELVGLSSPENSTATAFEIMRVPSATVFRRRGQLVQYVPPSIANHLGISEWVTLPPQSILVVRNPLGLEIVRAFGDLSLAGAGVMPEFAIPSMVPGTPNPVPFDFQLYIRTQNVVTARCTRAVGWNARGLLQKEALDYYTTFRELRFEEFKINLRDAVIEMVNEGLRRIGPRLGFEAKLVLEGLPSYDEIARARYLLETGQAGFDEILRQFRLN